MFKPRSITRISDPLDIDGVKIYTISVKDAAVEEQLFLPRLAEVKSQLSLDWSKTAAFCIFHRGESLLYLVLAWWGNDNELFTSVSVKTEHGWVEDPRRFSFCLVDLEVFWGERNHYVKTMYSGVADLDAYRQT